MSFLKRKPDPSNAIERELNDHERRLAARRLQLLEAEQAAAAATAERAQSLATRRVRRTQNLPRPRG